MVPLFVVIYSIILTKHDLPTLHAAVGECNFENYPNGCFSSANFECDLETNLCKCLPTTPILIEHPRICVEKVKSNGICQYNEQCDNANGYNCSSEHKLTSCQPEREPSIKCRCLKIRSTKQLHTNGSDSGSAGGHGDAFGFGGKHRSAPQSLDKSTGENINKQSTYSLLNFLPRLVWTFLILTLIGLVALLFLIKYQSNRRLEDNPFCRPDDLRSIGPEPDVPPPYEIAIRMKV